MAADRGAGRVLDHAGSVTLEHHFPGVACPGLRAPMGEEVTAVAALAAHGGHAKGSKLAARRRAGGDVGWSGRRDWDGHGVAIGGEYEDEDREKDPWKHHNDRLWFWHGMKCRVLRREEGLTVDSKKGHRLEDIRPLDDQRAMYLFMVGDKMAKQKATRWQSKRRQDGKAKGDVLALWSVVTGESSC